MPLAIGYIVSISVVGPVQYRSENAVKVYPEPSGYRPGRFLVWYHDNSAAVVRW
jgi:hypothetical protein